MYLSRQLYEEALHVQFYLTLLDTYVPDQEERHRAFAAVENIPSIRKKADFCLRWLDSTAELNRLETRAQRQQFLLNLICFAGCVEGLFFFRAFAYVYFLRSRGLLHGLAGGTNWVFRDESAHMAFAFEVAETIRAEEPDLSMRKCGVRSARCSTKQSPARHSSPTICWGRGWSASRPARSGNISSSAQTSDSRRGRTSAG